MTAAAVLLGATFALGVVLLLRAHPSATRPSLAQRVNPYVGTVAQHRPAAQGDGSLGAAVLALVRTGTGEVAAAVDRWTGGRDSVTRRLARLGDPLTAEQFRVQQVTWGAAALTTAAVVVLLRAVTNGSPAPVAAVVVLGTAFFAGVLGRDRWLTRQVAQRERRMRAEFPTIAELLALSVSAGEGATAALERVTRVARGELTAELRRAVDDVRVGATLLDSLQAVARRLDMRELTRFVDGVVVAVDRGTPLSAVLLAQAADARDAERRELIELGGKKDIAMMVPVVFLVLPLSVLFALFPGFYGITLTAP